MSKGKPTYTPVIENRKARHLFSFVEEFVAGMVLTGPEVKSIRNAQANLSDAFCYFRRGELFVKNLHISEYYFEKSAEQDPKRERKLLLKRRELERLQKKVAEKGLTLIPYKIFFTDRGHIKLQIALAKGKKVHDKRESIKERDSKRDLDRLKKMR